MKISQDQLEEAIYSTDSPAAIQVLTELKKNPSLNLDAKVITQLRYVRMNSLSERQLLDLMKDSVLTAYTIPNFDFDARVRSYIDQIDNPQAEIEFSQNLIKILSSSEEMLGDKNIDIGGVKVKPTLANWISDYVKSPSAHGSKDAFTQVEYINKSANAKILSSEERNIFKNIIRLYDHLNEMIDLWNSIPVPKNQDEAFSGFNINEFVPGLQDDEDEIAEATVAEPTDKPLAAPRVEQPSIKPTPVRQPQVNPRPSLDDISITPRESVKYKSNSSPAVEGPMSSSDSAKIRDLINHAEPKPNDKRGVTMDPTNIKINEEEQRLNQARAQQAASIQNKLAELRKRNSKQ